ncbi:MAG: hypothetical protein HYT87_20185 [Nitrospirae bacterium]|nr:hypothetical protein [Nitrospirota bacterium]
MPTARKGLAVTELNGKPYALGGDLLSPTALTTNEEYDPGTNAWSAKASLPGNNPQVAVAALDGKIYALDGFVAGLTISSASVYNQATNTWSAIASLLQERSWATASAAGGKIYLLGGRNSGSTAATLLTFDPSFPTLPRS